MNVISIYGLIHFRDSSKYNKTEKKSLFLQNRTNGIIQVYQMIHTFSNVSNYTYISARENDKILILFNFYQTKCNRSSS